jgi:predicted nucleic acid-binding Zn ribbon protein
MTDQPDQNVPDQPAEPAGPQLRRSGLDIAREARASARSEAPRLGVGPGRPSAPAERGDVPGRRRRSRFVDETRSGAHPDERDPQLLGPTLDRLVVERGWQTDKAVGDVMGRWPAIVGPQLAQHAVPVAFDDGELVLRADSTAWATQIRLLAPTLLARLAEDLGAGVVTTVTVRGPGGPSWKKGRLAVPGRGPRDTYG